MTLTAFELKALLGVIEAEGKGDFAYSVEVLQGAKFRGKPAWMSLQSVDSVVGNTVFLSRQFFRSSLLRRAAALVHQSCLLQHVKREGAFRAFLQYASPLDRFEIERLAFAEEIRFWMASGKVLPPKLGVYAVEEEFGRNEIVLGILRHFAENYGIRHIINERELWRWAYSVLASYGPVKKVRVVR